METILEQMKVFGKVFVDLESDYFQGIEISYFYDEKQKSFICQKSDSIVGSFSHQYKLSESEILAELSRYNIQEFIEQGFWYVK